LKWLVLEHYTCNFSIVHFRTLYKNSCRTKHLKMSHPGRDIAICDKEDRKRKREDAEDKSNKKKKEQSWELYFFDWHDNLHSKDSKLTDEDVVRLEAIQKKEVADYINDRKNDSEKTKISYFEVEELFNVETMCHRLGLLQKMDVFDDAMENNINVLCTDYYIEPTDLMFMIGRVFGPDGSESWTYKKYTLLKQIFSFMNEEWKVSGGDPIDFIRQMCGTDLQPLYFSVVRAAYYANALPSDVSILADEVASLLNSFLAEWDVPVDSLIEKYKSGTFSDNDLEFEDEYDERMIRKLIRMHVWLQSIKDKSDKHSWDTYRV
jgi:hypothetical protein